MDTGTLIIPLAFTAILCLVIGVLIGLLVASLRPPQAGTGKSHNSNLRAILQVLRYKGSGRLVIDKDDKLYVKDSELSPALRSQVVQVVEELRAWLGIQAPPAAQDNLPPTLITTSPVVPAQAQPSSSATLKVMQSPRPSVAPPVAQAQAPLPPALITQPPAAASIPPIRAQASVAPTLKVNQPPVAPLSNLSSPVQPPAVKPVSMNPLAAIVRSISSNTPKDISPPKTIAGQIDEILQEKLLNSPLREQGIRLMELPGKGLVVLIGLEEYSGVNEVPDPEVRALLKECVAEWEIRNYKT